MHELNPAAPEDAQALLQGGSIATGVAFARELGNLPPNICNPAYLADEARKFAAEHAGVEAEVLDMAQHMALAVLRDRFAEI